MKTQFIAIGLVAAALTATVAFADDAEMSAQSSSMTDQSSPMMQSAPAAPSDNGSAPTVSSDVSTQSGSGQ